MSTIGEQFRGLLTAHAALTARVGGRIFPNTMPQGVTLPAVRYTIVDDVPQNSLLGNTAGLRIARLQVDAFARTYLEVQAVADEVEGAEQNALGPSLAVMVLTRRDGYDDASELHRVSTDFAVSVSNVQ